MGRTHRGETAATGTETDGDVDDRSGGGGGDWLRRTGPDRLTVGVEEEFLLVDPHTGAAVPAVDLVMDAGAGRAARTGGAGVPDQPDRDRQPARAGAVARSGTRWACCVGALADAAERAGVRLLAIGTGPVAGPVPPVVDKPRFDRMIERFRLLVPRPRQQRHARARRACPTRTPACRCSTTYGRGCRCCTR